MPGVAARKQPPRLCLNDQALNAPDPGEFPPAHLAPVRRLGCGRPGSKVLPNRAEISRFRRLTKGADWTANPELSRGVKAAEPCYN
jgi:hypothetical protein